MSDLKSAVEKVVLLLRYRVEADELEIAFSEYEAATEERIFNAALSAARWEMACRQVDAENREMREAMRLAKRENSFPGGFGHVESYLTPEFRESLPRFGRCQTCTRPLDQPDDPSSLNCGGDCARCVALAGDPDYKEFLLATGPR